MALLDEPGRWPRSALLAATLLIACGGCALFERLLPERRFAFSHAVHVIEEELECAICHERASFDDEPGMPAPDTCAVCHEEIDRDQPSERQVSGLFDGESFRARRAAALADELRFSHKLHASRLECGACHLDIARDRRIDEHDAIPMRQCTDCHSAQTVPNECSTCHSEIDREWAPTNHAHGWMKEHGACARAKGDRAAEDCALCHSESDCRSCHAVMAPDDHTQLFRRRAHAFASMLDRDTCAACHEPQSCESCHREARPMSHAGSFASGRQTHCAGCHLPLAGEGCATCHSPALRHPLGAPKPRWHSAAMNCRQCHFAPPNLPHIDAGDDCNACHL